MDADIEIVHSDVFSSLSSFSFDKIIVNPPYYRGVPSSNWEYAFYAGQNLEYFDRLFSQAEAHMHLGGEIFMILSRDLDTASILAKASTCSLFSSSVYSKRVSWEWFDIFSIRPKV